MVYTRNYTLMLTGIVILLWQISEHIMSPPIMILGSSFVSLPLMLRNDEMHKQRKVRVTSSLIKLDMSRLEIAKLEHQCEMLPHTDPDIIAACSDCKANELYFSAIDAFGRVMETLR